MASEDKKFSRKANSSVGRVVRASFTKSSDDAALELEKVQAAFSRSSADASMSMGGMSSVTRVPLMYLDPMLDPVLLMFPKENIKEVNRRMRHYYTYHPIVNNVINLHSEYAISDYELKVDDPGIAAYYNELKEKWDLLTLMINLNRDFWLLGNGFLYGNWDESQQEWSSFNQYPPENIELHRTYVGPGSVAYLRPDEELKRVINSSREVDQAITSLIPEEFLSALRENRPFMLANSRLIHFARRPSAYALYGESALKPALKDLLYEDKLRLLQFTFADRSLYPIKHWKVGSESKGWIPSKKHFDALEAQLVAAANDPDQNIITNPFVNLQFHSAQSHRADLKAEFEFTAKRIMMALFAAENMLGGEASPYATSALNMRIVMHRYLMNRNSLERLLREKIFLPIAKARGLIKRTTAEVQHKVYSSEKKYILPRFFYTQRANLLSTTSEQELMLKLRDKGDIPFEMIADMFGWDKSSVISGLSSEEGTILDPLVKSAKAEVVKASVDARNSLISGLKLTEVQLPKDTAPSKGGRPTIPETEKVKPTPSILPMGDADLSSRSKGQERGTMPKPKEVREEPVNTPKAE